MWNEEEIGLPPMDREKLLAMLSAVEASCPPLSWDTIPDLDPEAVAALNKEMEEIRGRFKERQMVVVGSGVQIGKAAATALVFDPETKFADEIASLPMTGDYFFGNIQEIGIPDWKRSKLKIVKGRGHNKHKSKKK